MKTKTLIDTNPYLKDEKTRSMLIKRSVRTSSGVEGIKSEGSNAPKIKIPQKKVKKIYRNIKV